MQGILGNILVILHSHLSQTWWICNQLPYFLIAVTSLSFFFLICFQKFPGHQPSPPRSARHIIPLLTSTVEKRPLLQTSGPSFPEGSKTRNSLYELNSVSLSPSSIRSSVSGRSSIDVSALPRTNEVGGLELTLRLCFVWSSEKLHTFLCILLEISSFRGSSTDVKASNIRYNGQCFTFSR